MPDSDPRDRFVWKPGDVELVEPVAPVAKAVGTVEFKDLPTLVRRSFLAFMQLQAEAAADTASFVRNGDPRMERQDTLIPYAEQISGHSWTARVAPDGGVTREG